jgi:hypothetical protein
MGTLVNRRRLGAAALAAVTLAVGVTAAASGTVDATEGNTQPRVCTVREYRAIKPDMPFKRVKRILDGKGVISNPKAHTGIWHSTIERRWSNPSGGYFPPYNVKRDQMCKIGFYQCDSGGPWRAWSKWQWSARTPNVTRQRQWGQLANQRCTSPTARAVTGDPPREM